MLPIRGITRKRGILKIEVAVIKNVSMNQNVFVHPAPRASTQAAGQQKKASPKGRKRVGNKGAQSEKV